MTHTKLFFVMLSLCVSLPCVADDMAPEFLLQGNTPERAHYDSLVSQIKKGQEEGLTELQHLQAKEVNPLNTHTQDKTSRYYPSFYSGRPRSSDEQILELLDEVQGLKAKVVHTKAQALETKSSITEKKVGTKTYFTYAEGKIYEIHAGVDRVTDIELDPTEVLTNAPLAGDTVRWKIGVVTSGTGSQERTHLILKPLEENIETNILIPTSKRVYHIRAVSGDWYMPSVGWEYPQDEARDLLEHVRKQQEREPVGLKPDELRFDYVVKGDDYPWEPVRVFDDGKKTYFQMPDEMSVAEAPVLFLIDEHGEPMLVNYRVKGVYYIVDRLFQRAQMRVGKEGIVSIYSKGYEPSLFERLF